MSLRTPSNLHNQLGVREDAQPQPPAVIWSIEFIRTIAAEDMLHDLSAY
ncbi:hypothetical protein [Planctopirus limnophila]|nr:hypothetical protein [Planctopirus limnophila]